MTVTPSARLRAYVTAGSVGLIGGLAVGDPAPALIGTVLLVLGVVGLAAGSSPSIGLVLEDVPSIAVEGRPFSFRLAITGAGTPGRLFVDLGLDGLEIVEVTGARIVSRTALSLSSSEGGDAVVGIEVRPTTWGQARIGPLVLNGETPLGLLDLRLEVSTRHRVVVMPEGPAMKTLLDPIETNLHAGDLVSSRRGPGSEFSDLRPFRPGDDPRSVNWRVSSRLQSTWVNDRHQERNGDVVLLVDAQVESGTEMHQLVDCSIRLAASLLRTYGRHHHRLGLVTLDGLCRWVYPGLGELHRRRLLEQLMGVTPGEVIWEAAERAVIRAARRPSFVVALTPLTTPEMAGLIHTLRRSGVDISVVALDVEPALPAPQDSLRALGRRIWLMDRDRLRDRLAGEGVPVAMWRAIDPPDVPLARIAEWKTAWRRHG